ncbi:hypothetical protein CRG98_009898 [Punica granatum]|uniref:Reverse transcriptase domain-containing protein n=1 Tax=Punica granatum TaxID=22663 RepID=A0A2I0KMP0_PUNGR|nr:hypothetical protein CRG98_009898 [Punica granatum]
MAFELDCYKDKSDEMAPWQDFQRGEVVGQGDPISPYLFVIAVEVLSQLLDEAGAEEGLKYHPRRKRIAVTHLIFADDLLVFTNRSVNPIAAFNEEWSLGLAKKVLIVKLALFLIDNASMRSAGVDTVCWNDKPEFSIYVAWEGLRMRKPAVASDKLVRFAGRVPRTSFFTWLAIKDRFGYQRQTC